MRCQREERRRTMTDTVSKPEDVDSYIANADIRARPKLDELRELVRSTIPNVQESISYGVPFYRYCGDLAGFAAYKNHVSFGLGAAVLQSDDRTQLEELGYATGKRTIRITFDQDVPTTALQHILRAQAEVNEAKESG